MWQVSEVNPAVKPGQAVSSLGQICLWAYVAAGHVRQLGIRN